MVLDDPRSPGPRLRPLEDVADPIPEPAATAVAVAVPAPPNAALLAAPLSIAGATWVERLVWLFFFAAPASVFLISIFLTADPVGHGTHTQLGLPPCGFLVMTGLPCPGCGLTTCFTAMIHGDVAAAASANPFGIMLWLVSFSTMIVGAVGFVRGLPVIETLDRLQADKWAILLSVTSLTVWCIRVATMLAGQ